MILKLATSDLYPQKLKSRIIDFRKSAKIAFAKCVNRVWPQQRFTSGIYTEGSSIYRKVLTNYTSLF
jgi:hypothetical protein